MVPNFIDTEKINRLGKPCERSLLAQKEEKIITHISNFRPLKRIMDVIAIFERLHKELPCKLMMVGEGPEKINAVAQVKALGLEDKIIFLGNSNEIDKILCYSDLFLLPSEKESFGLSALEAMAHGVPVISSNAGGLAEVNKEGFSGYLAPVGDIETMAQKAKSLLTDEEQHAQFRTQAKKQASLFSIENVVGKYEAIYADAITSIRF